MLIGIDPHLSPELLKSLREMGHGDKIVVADANFPATSSNRPVIRLDGISAPRVVKAILGVMPLDSFVSDPAISMENAAAPTVMPSVVMDFQDVINKTADAPQPIVQEERFAFYKRAGDAHVIVQTGETRHFGNLILQKGVLPSVAS